MRGNIGKEMTYSNSSSNPDGLISVPVEKKVASESTSIEPVVAGKWPRALTLAFIVAVCGLSWAAIIAAFIFAR